MSDMGGGGCACLAENVVNGLRSQFMDRNGMVEYAGYTYDSDFGVGCQLHDKDLPPFCGDDIPAGELPEFCSEKFCYIDPDNCDLPIRYETSYFPGSTLHYSYQTCGSANTFANWFSEDGVEFGEHRIEELTEVIDNYVLSIRAGIEGSVPEWDNPVCDAFDCDCPNCKVLPGQCKGLDAGICLEDAGTNCVEGASDTLVDPWYIHTDSQVDITATLFKEHGSKGTASDFSVCMSNVAGDVMRRIAGKEYTDVCNTGYMYFGSAADGSYTCWPALDWCNTAYDPRFRPWYSGATTGPKNVVIVLDTSGSMQNANRLQLAKDATLKVLDTLTWRDYATIITFNSVTEAYEGGDRLYQVTDEEKAKMIEYVGWFVASGSTDFKNAYAQVEKMLSLGTDGGCSNVILFMTDGEADFEEVDYENLSLLINRRNALLFTYALGSGANVVAPRRMACENNGVFFRIEDGGDLGGAMSSYYTYIAAATSQQGTRWVLYNDVSGIELLASCTAIYDPREQANNELNVLLGVVCMDVNVMVPLAELQQRGDYLDFYDKLVEESTQCTPMFPGVSNERKAELAELIRGKLGAVGGETCFNADGSYSGGARNWAVTASTPLVLSFLNVVWLLHFFE